MPSRSAATTSAIRRAATTARPAVVVVALLGLLAACGDDETVSTAGETTTTRASAAAADVTVVAQDVTFPQDEYTAGAGEVTIAYSNDGAIPHTLVIETENGERLDGWERLSVDRHGDVDVGTAELAAGTYVLSCDIAGHRRAGMEATLVVEG